MKQFVEDFVTKKRGRLRMCVLLTLLICVAGLSAQPAVPVEADVPADQELAGLVVALDPGHGGYDGGARALESGLWEKEITLQMALSIEQALLDHGAQVVLTRRQDVCLADGDTATRARKRQDLQRRVDLAGEAGAQVFYQRGAEEGKVLAETLQAAIIDSLHPARERSALAGDYYVLRGPLPSALVECGFISNAQEEKMLLDPAYQLQFGQAVAQGLIRWRRLRGL